MQTLQNSSFEVIANPHRRRLTEQEVAALLQQEVIGMIADVEPLTRAVLAKTRHLKVISRCSIGLDSVDLEAAAERGIRIYNTPEATVGAVADLTLALMLGLLRRVGEADRSLRQSEWKQIMGSLHAPSALPGFRVK